MWEAEVLRQEESLIVLHGVFDMEISHDLMGTIAAGTKSVEYYWLDRWYNIFRLATPGGELRSYYCNVNVPPTFDGDVLSYVDLDIDILVEPDFSFQIIDLDDFENNAAHYGYSADVRASAGRALNELIKLIEMRAFPFDEGRGRSETN